MSPQVPPVNTPFINPGGIAPARPTPVSPALALVQAAPVRAAPAKISEPREPVRTQGRVTASNPDKKSVTVRTPQGDISIETDADIPPDTDVQVEVYQKDGQTVADLRLARQAQQVQTPQAPVTTPTPQQSAPPLAVGDNVTALVLPQETPYAQDETAALPPSQAALPPALAHAADLLAQAKAAGLQSLVAQLPVSPQVQQQLSDSQDLAATLQSLPLLDQERLKDFLNRPAVLNALNDLLADAAAQKPPESAALPAPAATAEAEPADSSLLNIIKAQISASLSHEDLRGTLPQQPASAGIALGQLKSLMPAIENADGMTTPAGFAFRALMPSASMAAQDIFAQKFQNLNIRAIFPPGTAPAQIPPELEGLTRGTIDMVTPAGYPIIAAGDEHMILKSPVSIAEGSTVFFESTPVPLDQLFAQDMAAVKDSDAFLPLFSKNWSSLQSAMTELAKGTLQPELEAQMQAQVQNLVATLPTPTARLVPTALFFLAALRMGGVENWIGPGALNALGALGKRNLAQKLGDDFDSLSTQSKELLSGEWRAISMPLLHDQQISQMQFFVRQQKDGSPHDEDGRNNVSTRFLLNLSLSRMGDMQLDGLLKKKNFDLILRSGDALPTEMRDALRQAFGRGLAQTGMEGGLTFQRKGQHWVKVDLPAQAPTVA